MSAPSPYSSPPPEPQAVLTPITESAIFLVLTIDPGGEETVHDLLQDVSALRRSVGFRVPDADLTCVVGIGSDAWGRLFTGERPAGLHPFKELRGPRHTAPSTPGDVLFHIRAHRADLCFELAARLMDRLRSAVTVADEVHGFKYFDERDLMGFVDGTENPEGNAALTAVVVGDEDPEFQGGSHVVVQKYLHELSTWNALPVEEQERVIGRTKLEDIELPDEVKPADSHVALNTITEPDGTERQIRRLNMPFGTLGENAFGTYFIGYSADIAVTEQMLRNMFLGTDEARHDRILDFSTAVTGSQYFAPGAGFLDDPPPTPGASAAEVPTGERDEAAAPARETAPAPAPADTSLRIGSLNPRRTS